MPIETAFQPDAFQNDAFQIRAGAGGSGGGAAGGLADKLNAAERRKKERRRREIERKYIKYYERPDIWRKMMAVVTPFVEVETPEEQKNKQEGKFIQERPLEPERVNFDVLMENIHATGRLIELILLAEERSREEEEFLAMLICVME